MMSNPMDDAYGVFLSNKNLGPASAEAITKIKAFCETAHEDPNRERILWLISWVLDAEKVMDDSQFVGGYANNFTGDLDCEIRDLVDEAVPDSDPMMLRLAALQLAESAAELELNALLEEEKIAWKARKPRGRRAKKTLPKVYDGNHDGIG